MPIGDTARAEAHVAAAGLRAPAGRKIAETPEADHVRGEAHGALRADGRLSRVFTEIIEETNSRGILTSDVIDEASGPIRAYFAGGQPLGLRMFGQRDHLPGQWLVKFSRQTYVKEMLRFGRFRIAPASEYAKASHLKAMKDLETVRDFKLTAIKEALQGAKRFVVENVEIKIQDGVVPVRFLLGDYYLFSTCREIDRRMPTDFEADAALIIKDRNLFLSALKATLLERFPAWDFQEREVFYFDPYNDIPKKFDLQFWKPFSFAYQKEHRCIVRPRVPSANASKLKPFFVELGSLDAVAEMVVAN